MKASAIDFAFQPGVSIRCEEIHTAFAFRALEVEYRSLHERSSRAGLFQDWDWLHNWWLVFGSSLCRLAVITFRRDERLIGCAPLVLRRPGWMPLRRLEPIGVLRSDYMDLVMEDGAEREVLEAFEDYLHRSRHWDLLDLQQLPEDSPTLAYFRERQSVTNCVIREQEICPYALLPSDWDEFLRGLGKKARYNVGYYRRMMERDFQLDIDRVGREDFDAAMEDLYRLHQMRWRKRRLPGALFDRRVRDFHVRAASDLLDRRHLDLYRLRLDGRAVAMLYCFGQNGRGYYYLGGFDPDYARYSAGTVLTAHAIQQSIARGDAIFDFLRGNEAYKYRWNVQEKRNYRLEWKRGGSRSSILSGMNHVTRAIERQAKAAAHRLEKGH